MTTGEWRASEAPPRAVQEYACGFLLGDDGRVVLIRKNRPTWQAGRLNGVGGHVEAGESPAEAMVREFAEETGLHVPNWEHYATISWANGRTFFYRSHAAGEVLDAARTLTDEPIEMHSCAAVLAAPEHETVRSLAWLLPLARYQTPLAAPVDVHEVSDA